MLPTPCPSTHLSGVGGIITTQILEPGTRRILSNIITFPGSITLSCP